MYKRMAGYIVYNGFWNTVPSDPVRRLVAAAEKRGLTLIAAPNTSFVQQIAPTVTVSIGGQPLTERDFVIFWDKDTRLAQSMEGCGSRVYNSAAAIAACDDKSETHRRLAAAGIPMPRTLLAPMAYTAVTAAVEPFLAAAEQTLGYPMVVKECYGSFGEQVYLVADGEELRRLAYGMGGRKFLLQEFMAAAAGCDTRLYVVGDAVAASICRRSESDFRANVELGGTVTAHEPSEQEQRLAQRCRQALGLDFCAVDLLYDKHGQPLVCEVNSNAYMKGLIGGTGVDVADHIVAYVLEKENVNGRSEGCFCR